MDPTQKKQVIDVLATNNFGITLFEGTTFWDGLVFYFPEILTLFNVMLHILKESLAGVFDVPFDRYETFEEGLLRYRIQMCQTDEER